MSGLRLPVRMLEADLATTYNGHLDLCEICYRLEASSVGAGRAAGRAAQETRTHLKFICHNRQPGFDLQ